MKNQICIYKRFWSAISIGLLSSAVVSGCGQNPLFKAAGDDLRLVADRGSKRSDGPTIVDVEGNTETPSSGGSSADATVSPDGQEVLADTTTTTTTTTSNEADPVSTDTSELDENVVYEIPSATQSEVDTLNRCIHSFKNRPFSGPITNFRRIHVVAVIGSTATPINDTKRTNEPELILVDVALNVSSQVTYNLLNPNGYYCTTLNMNIDSDLKINLHCHAQVADSTFSLQVNSNISNSASAFGIHLDSNVAVNDVRPSGDACVR